MNIPLTTHPIFLIQHRMIIICLCILLVSGISTAAGTQDKTQVTIAYVGSPETNIFNTLVDTYGFFEKNGLIVTPSYYPSGQQAGEMVVSGGVDFAMVNTFTVAKLLNTGEKPVILTSLLRIDEIYFLTANKKAGILSPEDLTGRKIGFVPGDSWEYYFEKYMALNGEEISSVTMVPLDNEQQVVEKLKTGEIDAGLMLYQYASALCTREPEIFDMWSVNNYENNYMLLISNPSVVSTNPEGVRNLIKAYDDAWSWFNTDTDRVKQEIGGGGGLTEEQMEDLISGLTPEVSLTQGLLSTLESQSRYLLKTGEGTITDTPDYLDIIDFSFLHDVSPSRCTIIH